MRIVPAGAARSARLTTHFDLDFPRAPQRGPYWCHKHRRECKPVEYAARFVRRYTLDTLGRLKAFARMRTRHEVEIFHGDALEVELSGLFDASLTMDAHRYPSLYFRQQPADAGLGTLDSGA